MKAAILAPLILLALLLPAGCTTPEGPLERTGRTIDKIGRNTARSVEQGAVATGRTVKKTGERVGESLE